MSIEKDVKKIVAVDLAKWLTTKIGDDNSTISSMTVSEFSIINNVLSEYFGCEFEFKITSERDDK